ANPNALPQKWAAVALLSPFDGSTMYISLITYDYSLKAMRTVVADYEGGFADLITINDSTWLLDENSNCLKPVAAGMWKVPAPDWVNSTDHNCAGIKPILEVPVQWWRYAAGGVGNWLWTRTDNGYPWRMMFVNDSNIYKLPLLGNFSMANFITMESINESNLGPIVNSCRQSAKNLNAAKFNIQSLLKDSRLNITAGEKEKRLAWLGSHAAGISLPDSSISLPVWPQTFSAKSLMTPVNRTATYPTNIFYDWRIKKQLTAMQQPDKSVVDAYLIDSVTYIVQKFVDSTQCQGVLPHLGPATPRWAYVDKCQSKLVLTNTPLSPNRKTLIFTCPIEEGRVFWIWYTAEGKPIVFFETSPPVSEGTSLSLADYYDFNPNVAINPVIFKGVPANCMANNQIYKKQRFHGQLAIDLNCNNCHNPVNDKPVVINLK
ncbi:MAG: hypothetical protein HYR66_10085, partial [Sphingobacteriales bacterium]|nr:hypothetical protein [Sphingobacteriales bacterium]